MKIAHITWRDSRIYMTQCSLDEVFEVCVIESVGFLISKDKDKVCLAGDLLEEDGRRIMCIPTENIVSIRMV